ncbi:hypothetical protein B0H17DRAFT_1142783 [Mycena rosella]|uniref:Uncharacterized protein n=1 Tax=Mycena rosella TaxID=1033263 RepID=A0AAD7CX31_MYCRO|nr:hypothetical protein B0H17DRAFT_1142783 [Mycena rosella]
MSEFATHRKELLSDWDKFSLWFSTAPSCSRCERLSLPGAMPNSKKNVGCSSCLDKKVACPRKSSYLFDLTKDSFFSSWAEFDKAEDALKIRKFRATRSAQNPIPGPLPLPLPVPFSVSLPLPLLEPLFLPGTSNPVPSVEGSTGRHPGSRRAYKWCPVDDRQADLFEPKPSPSPNGLLLLLNFFSFRSIFEAFWRDATPTRRYHRHRHRIGQTGVVLRLCHSRRQQQQHNNNNNVEVVKFGRTAHPTKCPWQWARQCKGQHQHWQYRWEVLFAAKFVSTWRLESLIHEHFKHAGAWLGPSKCGFCPVSHLEKYNYRRCGGRDAVVEVVETYLRRLRWVIVSTMHGVWIMPRRGEFIGLPGFEGINTLARVVYSAQTKVAEPPSSPANLAFQVFPNTRSSGPSRHMCLYRACKNYMWDHWRTEPLLRASGPWDQERQDEASGPRGETCRPSDEIVGPSTGSSRHAICSPDSGAGLGLGLAGGGWYDWGPHVHPGRTRRTASSSSPGSSSCWVYALGASGLCGGAASRLSLSFGAVVEGEGTHTHKRRREPRAIAVNVDDPVDVHCSFGGHGGLGRGSAHSLPSHSLRIQLCISLAPMQAALFVTSRSNPACLQCPTVPTLHAQVHALSLAPACLYFCIVSRALEKRKGTTHLWKESTRAECKYCIDPDICPPACPRAEMPKLPTRASRKLATMPSSRKNTCIGASIPAQTRPVKVHVPSCTPSSRHTERIRDGTPTCACRRVRILLCVRRPPPRAAIKLDPDVGVECVDPAAPVEAGTVGKAVRFGMGWGPCQTTGCARRKRGALWQARWQWEHLHKGAYTPKRWREPHTVALNVDDPRFSAWADNTGLSEQEVRAKAEESRRSLGCVRGGGIGPAGVQEGHRSYLRVPAKTRSVYWRLPSVVLAPTEQGTSARGAAYWAGPQRGLHTPKS